MGQFDIRDEFYLDGNEIKIISGAIHYFRIVPEYWRDRLEKLRAMGCNTVETYVPWNMHEQQQGQFSFEGILDLVKYIKLAQEIGLWVILRPSPYICAEWEFGGLPAWLLKEDGMKFRCSYAPFLEHVRRYYEVLIPLVEPLQITKGGPIIMVQIENEYGYYGNDKAYLNELTKMIRTLGITVPLVTSDGPRKETLLRGKADEAFITGNFGSKTKERFAEMKEVVDGPLMCMEFWVGWFDSWGNSEHMTTDLEQNKKDLEDMLHMGHVNFYMFIGGTNFGFMNGSNYYDKLTPDVTSYDYDAVLTEDGRITPKYKAFQSIISKFAEIPEIPLTTKISRKEYGKLTVEKKVSLFSVINDLSTVNKELAPVSMERLGQNYGYILYRTKLDTEDNITSIRLYDTNDRANIFVNKTPLVTIYDTELLETTKFEPAIDIEKNSELNILVENMGRVNYGPLLGKQRKGIDGYVLVNDAIKFNWDIYSLPLDNLEQIDFTKEYIEHTPAFYYFSVEIQEPADTFLDFAGWGKGCAFVNGFNIGRYWEKGPQKRLYIPGPLLKKGKNEIVLFETEGKYSPSIHLMDEPDLG